METTHFTLFYWFHSSHNNEPVLLYLLPPAFSDAMFSFFFYLGRMETVGNPLINSIAESIKVNDPIRLQYGPTEGGALPVRGWNIYVVRSPSNMQRGLFDLTASLCCLEMKHLHIPPPAPRHTAQQKQPTRKDWSFHYTFKAFEIMCPLNFCWD